MIQFVPYKVYKLGDVRLSRYECIGAILDTIQKDIDDVDDEVKRHDMLAAYGTLTSLDGYDWNMYYVNSATCFTFDVYRAIFDVVNGRENVVLEITNESTCGTVLRHEFDDDEMMDLVDYCTYRDDEPLAY